MEIAIQIVVGVWLEPILDRSVNQRTTTDALSTTVIENHKFIFHVVVPLIVLTTDVVRRRDNLW